MLQAAPTETTRRRERYLAGLSHCAGRGLIVVPAFNEADYILTLLESIAAQEPVSGVSVAVVANNCTDLTAPACLLWAQEHPSIPVIVFDEIYDPPNVGRVRQEVADAAVVAGCKWLLFLDADAWLAQRTTLRQIATVVARERQGCWVLASDEFLHSRNLIGRLKSLDSREEFELCRRILGFGSEFRCRYLPRRDCLFRFTSGTNTLIACDTYAECGGIDPLAVGSDSTLGENYLRRSGKEIGHIDCVVVPSARKHFSKDSLGGFIFYPQTTSTLEAVRQVTSCDYLNHLSAAECFRAIARDLRHFLLFLLFKREDWLRDRKISPADLVARLVRVYNRFCQDHPAPVMLSGDGERVSLTAASASSEPVSWSLEWEEVKAFIKTGE